MDDLANKTKKGIFWLTSAKIIGEVIHFGSSIILARLLLPSDFGINGIATIFTGYAMRLANFGFNKAIVQKEEINQEHLSSFFVFNLLVQSILCLLLIIISPFIGKFFDNPIVSSVIFVISFDFIITAFSTIPFTIINREMRFKAAGIIRLIISVSNILLCIVLALLNYGVWSLVYGRLVADAIGVVLATTLTGWLPSFKYRHQAFKELFSFGMWVFWKTQLKYLINNVDFFVVGKFLGPASLGLYERAYNIISMPQDRIGTAIDGVLFSSFSRIQKDNKRIRSGYEKALLYSALLSYPVFTGLIIIAPIFIPLLYGQNWQPTVVPLQIMCIAGLFRTLDILGNSIITAKGYVRDQVNQQIIFLLILTIGCFLGIRWGINGVSIFVTLANIVYVILMVNLLRKIGIITFKEFLIPQIPGFLYSFIMFLSLYFIQKKFFQTIHGTFLELFITILLGIIIYTTCVFIIKTKHTKPVVTNFKKSLSKIFT